MRFPLAPGLLIALSTLILAAGDGLQWPKGVGTRSYLSSSGTVDHLLNLDQLP
jgi:hypothetical protein